MTSDSNSYRSLLGIANVSLVLAAATLSRLAGRMFALLIVLYALSRFGSPSFAGWLSFTAMVPGLLTSPVSGAFLDRIGAQRAIILDMAASSVLLATLTGADLLASANEVIILLIVATYSLTSPLSAAGIRTLLPRLVSPAELDRINAVDTAIYAAADVLGPALAGAVFSYSSGAATFFVIAVAYALAACCLLPVHLAEPHRPHSGSIWQQTWEGLALVLREPTLRGLATSYSLYQMTWGALLIVIPVIVGANFQAPGNDRITGALWAIVGFSGAIGALVTGHLRTAGRERAVMAIGMAVTAVACWPIAACNGWAGVVVCLIIAGVAVGPVDVGLLTLRQRRTDPSKFGRVLSVSMSLNLSGLPIGSAVAGLLLGISANATFLFAAAAAALAAFLVRLIPTNDRPR
ncbi:MFS transporter [Paraburkholderia tropica]|uniref:MFS transporter n=1 Tax=Paraburkholderia tropica TaxID=92647 RepID=UPI002AB604EA|nr:MFS transporter [Paraburkholderia tropica]